MNLRAAQSTNNEVAESLVRRKFQRTTSNANAADDTFRKPSLPASASRPQTEQRSGINHHRRRSTLRDQIRVPSGPREFPSPGRRYDSHQSSTHTHLTPSEQVKDTDYSNRVGSGSISSLTPAVTESTNTSRSFLSQTTSEPFFSNTGEATHFTFANPTSSSRESPLTPAQHTDDDFGFIPTVNFDDLQNSIANYDGNGPLLSDFSMTEGDRPKPNGMNNGTTKNVSRPPVPRLEPKEEQGMTRSQSLRRRLSGHPAPREGGAPTSQGSHLSLRTRRQSTVPQGPPPSGPAPPPTGAGTRPRKSLGPGVIASMMEGRKISQPLSSGPMDLSKSDVARTNSLTKAARRTTIQPGASGGAELPRASTLTATTQSRANKVKSLQPPPRDQDPNTPHLRSLSKNNQNRAHTPSSSGNKRQSTVSGRASGLGARTISPTDARRLKRLSMMPAPPVPSNPAKNNPPSPQEESQSVKPELPRFTQPSPSLIPRKANATPTSARASPEGRFVNHGGGVSLSSKSSFQSLLTSSASASRLPTPKPRNVHSSSAQYGEDDEIVPPVPAIPKNFESPRENDLQFFSSSVKSSQYGHDGLDHDLSFSNRTPKSSVDMSHETRGKASVDLANAHQRINTIENIERSVNMTAPKAPRAQVDPTGRKNNNLQPLRLPPLNLMPINQPGGSRGSHLPRPSQDLDMRDDYGSSQTPEPRRVTKTPSTPMTASKATFFRRHDEDMAKQQGIRSSSSHYALRDLMQLDDATTSYFDDADAEYMAMGLPIPSSKPRNAITPFASGSLPKGSGEYGRRRGRPSIDFNEEFTWNNFETLLQQSSNKPQGPRPSRSGTKESLKPAETPSSLESPVTEQSQNESKKEGGLRRRLSLNWRRSSSSKANHPDQKPSSHPEPALPDLDKIQKRASQMPPPKLPASAAWAGDAPILPPPSATRTSLDSLRRKGEAELLAAASLASLASSTHDSETKQPSAAAKNKSIHAEQPQPINVSNRASSWGNIGTNIKPPSQRTTGGVKGPQQSTTPTISTLIKDKDDHAADDEMRRLSQKRRDVDTAARESEELKKRAVPRSPMTPDRVLHDRHCNLNIFERGEVMDYEKDGIYFTGTKTARKIIGALTPSPSALGDKDAKAGNFGYDDERGDYNIVLGDHLAYRYEVVDVLGKGSFGQVVRCVDHKDGGIVAVKIIRNKKRFHQQALVEVGILGRLREWVSPVMVQNQVDPANRELRILMVRMQRFRLPRPSTSARTSASLRRVSASTFTSSSGHTTLSDSRYL